MMNPLEIIALIKAGIQAGETVYDFIQKLRLRAMQDRELTPEEEAAFDDLIKTTTSQTWWKPEVKQTESHGSDSVTVTVSVPTNPKP